MKRTTIHISATLALLLALAACTQDEAGFLPEGAEGTPIVFTATGLNPAVTATAGTRAPVDGNWEGVQSVAVRMDGTVKAYDVTPITADNTGAMLTSDDPHYWTNHTDRLVTAWWPYSRADGYVPTRLMYRLICNLPELSIRIFNPLASYFLIYRCVFRIADPYITSRADGYVATTLMCRHDGSGMAIEGLK